MSFTRSDSRAVLETNVLASFTVQHMIIGSYEHLVGLLLANSGNTKSLPLQRDQIRFVRRMHNSQVPWPKLASQESPCPKVYCVSFKIIPSTCKTWRVFSLPPPFHFGPACLR